MDEEKKKRFTNAFSTDDLVVRPIDTPCFSACLFYLDGMTDAERLEQEVIKPLLRTEKAVAPTKDGLLAVISFSGNVKCGSEQDAINAVAAGDAVLLIDEYFLLSSRKSSARAVTEPPTTSVVKGPRAGFVEDVKTNMVLLRQKIRSNRLIYETLPIGTVSATTVVLAYVDGITPVSTVESIKKRLTDIEIDGIMDSSYVAKIIEQRPYSIFKQIGSSEKVDVVASKLLDGRVAILADGSPIVLTIPFLLIEDFEDSQDLYKKPALVDFSRLVRLFGVFFALFLPAAFVAVQSHQYQILPLQLMITILDATGGIPFSPTLEMIIALLLFEILSEASIRMPKHVGMALSVVGAIVLGQTAVEAGFLSSLTVLIVAMSGIGIFTVPDQVGVISTLRIFAVVVAGLLGVYGILLFTLAVLAYLSEMSSFGVPYLAPFAPIEGDDIKDALLKQSLRDRRTRPYSYPLQNKTRLKTGGAHERNRR